MKALYTYHQMSIDDDKLSCQVKIDPVHNVFQGHFPDMAVMPGVCMIQMMIDAVAVHLDADVVMHQASMIKFIHMWLPDVHQEADLNISFQLNERELHVKNCVLSAAGQPFFKFKGRLNVGS